MYTSNINIFKQEILIFADAAQLGGSIHVQVCMW